MIWVGAVPVGPEWVHKAGMRGWVRKKFHFWQKHSPNYDFFFTYFYPIRFQKHMTGGSGVRDKTGLI
jgi:hypothetical protein